MQIFPKAAVGERQLLFSIWDCKKNELTTITKEAWDKINNSK